METDVVEIVADLATGWETTEVAGMTITERIAPLAIGGQVEVYRPSEKMIAAEVIDTAIDTILPEIEEVMEIVIETVDMAAIVIEVNNDVTELITGVPTRLIQEFSKKTKSKKGEKNRESLFSF